MENFDLHTGSKISKHTILESKIQKEINFKDFTQKNEFEDLFYLIMENQCKIKDGDLLNLFDLYLKNIITNKYFIDQKILNFLLEYDINIMPVISKHCVNNSNTIKQYALFFNYQSLIKHLERNKKVDLPLDKGLYSHVNNTTGIALNNFPDSIRIEDDLIYLLIKFQKNVMLHQMIDKKSYILTNNLIDILIKNNFLYALPEFFYNDLIKTQHINYIFNQYKEHFDYIYKMDDLLKLNYLDNSIFLYVLNKVKLTEEELVDYLSEHFEYYFNTNNNINPHELLKDLNQQYSKDNKLKTNLIDNF